LEKSIEVEGGESVKMMVRHDAGWQACALEDAHAAMPHGHAPCTPPRRCGTRPDKKSSTRSPPVTTRVRTRTRLSSRQRLEPVGVGPRIRAVATRTRLTSARACADRCLVRPHCVHSRFTTGVRHAAVIRLCNLAGVCAALASHRQATACARFLLTPALPLLAQALGLAPSCSPPSTEPRSMPWNGGNGRWRSSAVASCAPWCRTRPTSRTWPK